ncbi:hypothetical protein Halru_1489 [Halovivax ruber XH-70]|uniref:GNAT family acetyltransferase n=1 Tax=Halovivax ruber (strain DSM 18193 / JCM 13892 / XH-70) TaxID=797302 RepID=L0IDP9_HALRX|nr:DUF5816 domain-containing protein [Halovivax ruber]AGB16097.1 hypothetical protein Halru_1489 [Halovivax ruber XH-70]
MEPIDTELAGTLYLSRSEGDRGSKGPFFVVYETRSGDDRFGWFCSACDSVDTAMDSMGRIQCNQCGNQRKPTEWDAAHE